ncbi:MAG: PQ-loop domain-containing transporter [Actinomycetota bacterium]|nr:PQ-loop domain-containing transporter [Actinomycetota bacterium]
MIVFLGLASGALTTGAWLPQLWRTWRRGRADDISFGYLAAFGSGVVGWVVYGAASGQAAVLAANGVTLALVAALVVLKLRPRRPALSTSGDRGRAAGARVPTSLGAVEEPSGVGTGGPSGPRR